MRAFRSYLPVIMIALWAVALLVFGHVGHVVRAVAWLSIAVAFKISIDEARRQHVEAKGRRTQ